MKTKRALLCLLCLVMLLGGCGKKSGVTENDSLPSPQPIAAPRDDSKQTVKKPVLLYLPSTDGTRLVAVPAEGEFSVSRHPAETLCRLLYAHPGNDYAAALPEGVVLSGTQPVEVSGNTATVSLSAGALRLNLEEMQLVCQATANTLSQMKDVQYVNVLINGIQPGRDLAATQPAGCFQFSEQAEVMRSRAAASGDAVRQTISASLYYPAAEGRGIVCESRALSFESMDYPVMLKTLLTALQEGPVSLQHIPRYPDLLAHLQQEPQVTENNGRKWVVLHFDSALNEAILDQGIPRSMMAASLVYTMTTFVPGVEGVEIHIGEEKLQSLTPLAGDGETITFENGLMKRSSFSPYLLSGCVLYFAGPDGMLRSVVRHVPYYESRNARFIIGQLMLGPQDYDSASSLEAVMPKGLGDAELLGVAMEGDTLVLHFSEKLLPLCENMAQQQERNLVYAMVNSLCELPEVKKVRILVNDRQPETLAGYLYMPGSFLPNRDILRNE